MTSKSTSTTGSFSLPTWLLIIFITLKLTHEITWSWWWVLSPIWIMAFICLFVGIGVFIATQN